MGLIVTQVAVGGYDNNFSYLIHDHNSKEALVVDPSGDLSLVLNRVTDLDLTITGVLLTHTHFDHHDALPELLQRHAVPVHVHELGANSISATKLYTLSHQDIVKLGGGDIQVLHTPGHIDDAVCFYIPKESATNTTPQLISGDTLFVGGCGRTNEAGVEALFASLKKLANLPRETVVYPGHDYGSTSSSTIGRELRENKYYQVKSFTEFKSLRLG